MSNASWRQRRRRETKGKVDLSGKPIRSYGNGSSPITIDMGGFYVYYRNHLGGARKAFHKVADHNEARNETINLHGGEIDISPVKVERIDIFGNHTHTWYSECIWDSALRLRNSI